MTKWPYEAVGAALRVLGVAFMVLAHVRVRTVERAVDRGDFARLDERLGLVLLSAGVVLGMATVALVVFTG